MTTESQRRWRASFMDNYGTPHLALAKGQGVYVWDTDGNRYLDLFAGIAVNALGHAHPAIVEAVSQQISLLSHTSNLFITEPELELAETLGELIGAPSKVLFVNSGAEANEAAFKISRLTGRSRVIACQGAFHGRTMGALALTGQPTKSQPFEPLTPGVMHVPFGDIAALESTIDADTAALFVEPVLGEGGVIPAPEGYLRAARDITRRHDTLLVIDEIQTGVGRTGSWFAFQQEGIVPDVITLAKGLGGGLPLGACIGIGAAADLLRPGQHGTTFGGNPMCCAAGLAVLRTIAKDDLCQHAALLGKDMVAAIRELNHPLIRDVRGKGLLLAIVLVGKISDKVASVARDAGYLLNNVQPDVIRLAPPLILSKADADDFVAALSAILDNAVTAADKASIFREN